MKRTGSGPARRPASVFPQLQKKQTQNRQAQNKPITAGFRKPGDQTGKKK